MKKRRKIETETKKGVYFLNNNEEVKIVTKTIPHEQIFITNKNGKILVESYFKYRKRTINEKTLKI